MIGAAGEDIRIRPALRLGHGEAGHNLAVHQRLQVLRFLRRRAEVGEDFGVAGVRRGGAKNSRGEKRAAEDFVHQRELQLAPATTAHRRRQMAGPQPLRAHLGFERRHDAHQRFVARVVGFVFGKEVVERLNLLANESLNPVQLALEFGLGFKIPHGIAA